MWMSVVLWSQVTGYFAFKGSCVFSQVRFKLAFPIKKKKKKILIESAFNLHSKEFHGIVKEESKSQVMLLTPVEGQQTEMLLSKKLTSSLMS